MSFLDAWLQTIKSRLTSEEANRFVVYDDATGKPLVPGDHLIGHPTIGVGRALDTHGISEGESDFLLANDIQRVYTRLAALDWFVSLPSPDMEVAIIDMAFQMGVDGVLKFVTMIDCIKQQKWLQAKQAMLNSDWARETPTRANRVADLFYAERPC